MQKMKRLFNLAEGKIITNNGGIYLREREKISICFDRERNKRKK